jgi:transglutaminase-like putative cysteine protease
LPQAKGMNYIVTHRTAYSYLEPVSLCHNIIRLLPRDTDTQFCRNVTVSIVPEPDTLDGYEDFFGNKLIYFCVEKEHRLLEVIITSEIEINPQKQLKDFPGSLATAEEIQRELNRENTEAGDIRQYVFETPLTLSNAELEAYARYSLKPNRPVFEAVVELMHRIHQDFEFKAGATTIATPLATVMRQRKGVCQDFAHLAIACVRSVGLPARYVSGYIETIPPPGADKLVGADASHAWFSVYIPEAGWVDFDPTNNVIPSTQHITIGWGRDYSDIAPLKGIILSSGSHELTVSVDVRRGYLSNTVV